MTSTNINQPAYNGNTIRRNGLNILNLSRPSESFSDIENIWKQILITEEPPEEVPLVRIGEINVLTANNHSLIQGKKKARKTLFLVWLLSQYDGDLSTDVLFFDTEQGKRHVYQIRRKLHELTRKEVPLFYLRGKSPQERRKIIAETVKHWPTRPKLIVIDGVRDLLSNINDPVECTDLLVWIEALIAEHGLHVVNVLHLNKTDSNARGHIGTELQNKAETIIEIEKDEQAGCSMVKCPDARDQPFEPFAFTHGADGLPEIVDNPIKGEVFSDAEQRARLKVAFDGELLKRGELIDAIKSQFEIGKTKAENLLARYTRNGWIIKNGKDRSPNTVYKLAFG